ncbi:MAG: hypothetical protein WBZ42_09095, partial [Halobacteriota archaeon]
MEQKTKLEMKLNNIARKYDPASPKKDFEYWYTQFDMNVLEQFLIGKKVIELGCYKGAATE